MRLKAFAANRRGGVAILFAFAIFPLVGAIGISIDAARGYLLKQKLVEALDLELDRGLRRAVDVTEGSVANVDEGDGERA